MVSIDEIRYLIKKKYAKKNDLVLKVNDLKDDIEVLEIMLKNKLKELEWHQNKRRNTTSGKKRKMNISNLTYNPTPSLDIVLSPCIEVASRSQIVFFLLFIVLTLIFGMFINANDLSKYPVFGKLTYKELIYILYSTSIVLSVIIGFSIY